MTSIRPRVSRLSLTMASSLAAVTVCAMPASAQTIPGTITERVPLSDTNCNFDTIPPPTTVPPCTVIGTRSTTLQSTTRTAFSPTIDRIDSTYLVNFNGQLQVDGFPTALSAGGGTFPVFRDASFYFDNSDQTVTLASTYTGVASTFLATALPTPNQNVQRTSFTNYSSFNNTVSSIVVDNSGTITTTSGGTYDFGLAATNPAAIINGDSVAVSGLFNGTSGTGAIQFGRLTGTSTLVNGPVLTLYPAGTGAANVGLISPFALNTQVVATIDTQLDETGLITPRVEVTQGIDMNGSKITELGAGTAPTDAVNFSQLTAESTARTAALTAATQRIATEENTRATADLALASQIGGLGNRLGSLETHVALLDDMVASSTAVAVAMGGATFLPGMKFNLTANVATYDGAHAGAVQIGALVSDHVALNAGVATGFNKHGKTAGRVGFTVGW